MAWGRHRRGFVAAACGLMGGTALASGVVQAAEWRITPIIQVTEAYNSNIDVSARGTEISDYITNVSPGVGVRGSGRQLTLNADYSPEFLFFADESSRNEVRQQFSGFANSELVQQRLFLDVSGTVSRHEVGQTLPAGQTELTANNNLRQVIVADVSPSYRQHFGSYADAEVRFRHDRVSVDANQVSDTTTNEVSLAVISGEEFSVLKWQLSGQQSHTDRDGGAAGAANSDIRRRLGKADFEYAVAAGLGLIAGVGHEEIKDSTLREPIDGLIWDAGFVYRPSRATSLRATHGERFEQPNTSVALSHAFTPRTVLTASYAESVETSQGLLQGRLGNIGLDETARLVNSTTQQPFTVRDDAFGLTNTAFRQEVYKVALDMTRGRSTYRLSAFRDTREFDVATGTATSTGGSLGFTRALTRWLNGSLNATYRRAQFDTPAGRTDASWTVQGALRYQISESLEASLSAEHSQRENSFNDFESAQSLVAIRLAKKF
jgi:uncharacterized protein (PEP-CTERM system associated)